MARHDNNYGAHGSNRDEFGELPPKRIEKLDGSIEVQSKAPVSLGLLIEMIIEFYQKKRKKPNKLIYPGIRSYTTSVGVIINGLGYVDIQFYHMPNAKGIRLE